MASPQTTQTRTGVPPIEVRHRMEIAMDWAGLTRTDMAELLGVSLNTISNYTNGNTRPPEAAVKLWAFRCGVPYKWLKTGVEPDPSDGVDESSTICETATVVRLAGHSRAASRNPQVRLKVS